MSYVIACGDDGVQINVGTRLGLLGSGLKLPDASKVFKAMKKVLGEDLRIASSAENDWTKKAFELDDYEQANATMQQQVEALADREGLLYSGYLPFSDPRQLKHEIKGHMVRPKGVHIANKICFTLGGGEQTYNLGHYQISADWVHAADKKLVKKVLKTQVDFYQTLAGDTKLSFVFEMEGELGEDVANKNRKVIEGLGFTASS